MQALLGIDVGTSGCKVIATSLEGECLGQASYSYLINYPREGWAEQNPDVWYEAACQGIRRCLDNASLSGAAVQALSVTGPAHHVALLGDDGRILRPTIHWSDLRSEPQCLRLLEDWGPRLQAITGQRLHPSWTLPQLLWLRQHEPGVWQKLGRILATKDYVRHRLTGDFLTDPYDAVGTMLCELGRQTWSDEIVASLGLPRSALPAIRPADSLAGKISHQAARETGLLAGTPVAVGSGDSAVEALGAGATRVGDGLIKLGSSANVDVVTQEPRPSDKTITYPFFVAGLGFTVTATTSGAASWRWFRGQALANGGGSNPTDAELMQLAAAAGPGAEGLLFHPFLMGERVPYWDASMRASFIGLTARHNMGHFARAVLEGVAFSLRDCMAAVEQLGSHAQRLRLLGGGSGNPLWNQIISDVLGRPLSLPRVADASLGAALLAGRTIGVFADWAAAAAVLPADAVMVHPDERRHQLYSRIFQVYQDSIGGLGDISRQLQIAAGLHAEAPGRSESGRVPASDGFRAVTAPVS